MNKILKFTLLIFILFFTLHEKVHSQGKLDPVRLNSWVMNVGFGPGAQYFDNGAGFGPALKVSFEKGMWDVGPGVVTMGGEATFSFFSNHYGEGWNESWTNFFLGARSAFHYGWNVPGLDTYGGVPLGIGFSIHTWDDHPGNSGYTPVFPYFGIFFGASYFFTPSVGINGEVGYSSTHANLGLVFRLK